MAPKSPHQTVIIRKIIRKSGEEEGQHGAWKIAYADFVTAMMAFFLLMWLISMVSDEGREGIARYFTPIPTDNNDGGAGGIMGGTSISSSGFLQDARSTPTLSAINAGQNADNRGARSPTYSSNDKTTEKKKDEFFSEYNLNPVTKEPREDQINQFILDKENRVFEETKKQLLQAIEELPELKALKDSFIIEQTPEGLRIQIVDQKKISMFPSGGANMFRHTYELLAAITKVIKKLDNKISISGHTDSEPFSNSEFYTNWELSSDRSNASRRVMIENGFPEKRISYVAAKGSSEPLDPKNPKSERNRRISIVLLRQNTGDAQSRVSSPPLADLRQGIASEAKAP